MSGAVETQKEGERILAATRRPDGTLRKPVRIRAGYTPQDEVAVYQSKGALLKHGKPLVPPGYDPDTASKPKTKAAKKNEKRKEKKQQAMVSSTSTANVTPSEGRDDEKAFSKGLEHREADAVAGVVEKMDSLTVSTQVTGAPQEESNSGKIDLEKRIRALRKKIRSTETLQASSSSKVTLTQEQLDKLSKLDMWREELHAMEVQLSSTL